MAPGDSFEGKPVELEDKTGEMFDLPKKKNLEEEDFEEEKFDKKELVVKKSKNVIEAPEERKDEPFFSPERKGANLTTMADDDKSLLPILTSKTPRTQSKNSFPVNEESPNKKDELDSSQALQERLVPVKFDEDRPKVCCKNTKCKQGCKLCFKGFTSQTLNNPLPHPYLKVPPVVGFKHMVV